MGGGSWNNDAYKNSSKGIDAFKYSDNTKKKPRAEQTAAEELSPYGLVTRESRDNEEHPESNAVAVGLDITGSMTAVVVEIRDGLGKLMNILLDHEILTDPQLLFYAIGDEGMGDVIPVQISQFESDIRINDQLSKVVLVGGGGGNMRESYEQGLYAMARHTALDCLEKRGKKGYLATIGDERAYDFVNAGEVKKIFKAKLESNVPIQAITKEVMDKFNVIHIIPKGSYYFNNNEVRKYWTDLVGETRVVYPAANAVCETIAVYIGISEGKFTLEGGVALIKEISGAKIANEVKEVLSKFAESLGQVKQKTSDSTKKKTDTTTTDPNTGKPKKNKPGKLF
ncbi:MAG: hypothetical protein HY226_05560 [Candidatus Vogelbacteria bacterium]|nr:hypothetical protein [Candidatus Vogelbacteria bacterium]